MAVSPDKLNAFMGKAVGDIGAAMSANTVLLGDKLGLYKTMAKAGPVTPAELAKTTKTAERYVRDWRRHRRGGLSPHRREPGQQPETLGPPTAGQAHLGHSESRRGGHARWDRLSSEKRTGAGRGY
jgi:hypothetical protein